MKRNELKARQREKYLKLISDFLIGQDEDVLRVESGTIAFPIVDEEGNEDFITVKIAIPSGTRDGEAYDAYSAAQDYEFKVKAAEEKRKEIEAKKAAKIAKDEKLRASKAAIKAKRV